MNILELTSQKIAKIKIVVFDFDGVFTDNSVLIDENGIEYVRCTRADGIGLEKLKKINIKILVISSEKNSVVLKRAEKLEIECINNTKNKKLTLLNFCKKQKIKIDEVMYVGNDINDIPALKISGISVGVNDSHPDIQKYTQYTTNKKGGYGAVREICDVIEKKYQADSSSKRNALE
jgi:3-deoxy-D-manno-octulosonate 8-phosphate phosphatase (KDO 8-P phosphatase)